MAEERGEADVDTLADTTGDKDVLHILDALAISLAANCGESSRDAL